MSDVGVYDAVESEIVAALTPMTPLLLTRIVYAADLNDLVFGQGINPPVAGVIEDGADGLGTIDENPTMAVGGRLVRTVLAWNLNFVVRNQRGAVEGRVKMRKLLETSRDILHGLRTTTLPTPGRFFWRRDTPEVIPGKEDILAYVAHYEFATNFGR